MIHSFSDLPAWLLFIIIVGGSIGLSCGATQLMHRRHRKLPPIASRSNDLIIAFFVIVGSLYGIILGFLVVSVWQTFQAAEMSVSQEAAAIVSLARYSLTLPEPMRAEMHDQLRRYTEDVINNEWKTMQVPLSYTQIGLYAGSTSASTDVNALWIKFRQISPDSTSLLDNLSQHRVQRLLSSTGDLPVVFWVLLIFGAMVTASLGLILQIENQRLHIFLMASLTGLISLCLWFILLFNNPFAGDIQVPLDILRITLNFIDHLPR